MKKLNILFVLLFLVITTQAQDRSQLIGAWKIDKALTFKLNPKLQKEYNEAGEKYKRIMDFMLSTLTIQCSKDGSFEVSNGDEIKKGTWKLVDNIVMTSIKDGDRLKEQNIRIASINDTSMVLLDEGVQFGYKRIQNKANEGKVEAPKFSEGKFGKYLGRHIQYPKQARDAGIEGKVIVGFFVEKDGSLSDIHVVKSLSPECDKEAMRVIQSSSPRWIPGKIKGKIDRVKVVLPIIFRLE